MCTASHRSGEEGHLSPGASDQGLPPKDIEPQTGKELAKESITIQGPSRVQCSKSTGFKEKLLGKQQTFKNWLCSPIAFGGK